MAVMPVNSQFMLQGSFIREQTDAYHPRKFLDSKKSMIEEEISMLRRRLEQVAQAEKSFTSEIVIQLSMKLDEKLNEYNALINKRKR